MTAGYLVDMLLFQCLLIGALFSRLHDFLFGFHDKVCVLGSDIDVLLDE